MLQAHLLPSSSSDISVAMLRSECGEPAGGVPESSASDATCSQQQHVPELETTAA
jgi:hypothetical protein